MNWKLSNAQLLNLKLSELPLSLKGSFIEPLIKKLMQELKAHKLPIKPRFWLSDEWFSPDKSIGIAIPFYLVHPRLLKLEKEKIGFAEGESVDESMKLLRHELAHVIDNAYGLRSRRERVKLFGKSSQAYRDYYTFKANSRDFVCNIEDAYAQSHPVEDFAETLAVWLDPNSNWKNKYKGWPVMKKLEYIDKLMGEIRNKKPVITERKAHYSLSELNYTVKEYYEQKIYNLSNLKKKYKVKSQNLQISFR